MFSFFRKKSACKESKPEQQTTDCADEENQGKKKIKSDKKTLKETKKIVAFKPESEPNVNSSTSNVAASQKVPEVPAAPPVPPVIVLIAQDKDFTLAAKTLIDYSSHDQVEAQVPSSSEPDDVFQQPEEPPEDVFCEAQEVIQPEMNCSLSQPDDTSELSNSLMAKDLSKLNVDDKQQQSRCRRRVSFNDEETVIICDPGDVTDSAVPDAEHKLPITIAQRDFREAAASFLSEDSSPLPHDATSSIIPNSSSSSVPESHTHKTNASYTALRVALC